ncbi:MAG: helix-turn-helix transcriptional regulator [Lachnospiraceae bacterium]|nr:helix-turn-helix transcriptional regulator [Lachnospiraceae bacterium]
MPAKHLHVSQRSYSHYENGDRAVPIDVLEGLPPSVIHM